MKRNRILTAVVVAAVAFLAAGCASKQALTDLEAKVDAHRAASQTWATEINTRQIALSQCFLDPTTCVPPDPGTQPPPNTNW
jgi:outer membrane murein-binding lipoprotein Lpp